MSLLARGVKLLEQDLKRAKWVSRWYYDIIDNGTLIRDWSVTVKFTRLPKKIKNTQRVAVGPLRYSAESIIAITDTSDHDEDWQQILYIGGSACRHLSHFIVFARICMASTLSFETTFAQNDVVWWSGARHPSCIQEWHLTQWRDCLEVSLY